MVSIALVSGRLTGATANVNTDAMLDDKSHTVTFFDQSAVTAGNLSAFGLIYVNVPDQDDTTFEGHIRAYMRTDNIPVIVAGFDGTGSVIDSLTTRLGIAQSITGAASEGITDAVTPTGFEDLQVVAGLDPDFLTRLRQVTDEGWFVPKAAKHKGTTLLKDAAGNVIFFQALSTETDFTDTTQTLGARFAFVGWSGDDGHGREGAALIEAAIQWAVQAASFSFPITGNQFAITRPADLDRPANYNDSEVNWTPTTPASTTIVAADCQDELVVFTTVAAAGDEIDGFSLNDPMTGHVFVRWILASTLAANTPQVDNADLFLDGQAPALRQLGAPTATDHDPTVLAKDDWYTHGLVTFLTGENANARRIEVRRWVNSSRTLELFLPMNFPIAVGDVFEVYVGCAKPVLDCRDKFDNVVNYRGEPYIPGNDALFRTPDAPQG